MRSRFCKTWYHKIISITIIVRCMLFKFCFGEKRIYSSLATTAWFEFGIRFIKARVHFWMHHLKRTYVVNHLVIYLNCCCSCGSQLFQKKKTNSAGICLEPSFLNDAPRLGESSVTHPRWGGGGVESWEGVQLGSWTPPKILQRQGDLRTCQELNTKWIGEKDVWSWQIKMLRLIFAESISTIL